MRTLTFEENGQDFTAWDLDEAGKVVGCRPYQAHLWRGAIVLDHNDLQPGDRLLFISRHMPGKRLQLRHRIRAIKDHPQLRTGLQKVTSS